MRLAWTDKYPVVQGGSISYYPGGGWPAISSSVTESEAAWLSEHGFAARVLEVGTAYGYSTICLASGASFVLTIDPHDTHASLHSMRSYLRIYGVERRVLPVVGRSDVVLPMLAGESFDMAFIDGDHTTAGVMYDAVQAARLVKPGGLIAFHDYGEDTCPEVAPSIERVVASGVLLAGSVVADTLYVTST